MLCRGPPLILLFRPFVFGRSLVVFIAKLSTQTSRKFLEIPFVKVKQDAKIVFPTPLEAWLWLDDLAGSSGVRRRNCARRLYQSVFNYCQRSSDFYRQFTRPRQNCERKFTWNFRCHRYLYKHQLKLGGWHLSARDHR